MKIQISIRVNKETLEFIKSLSKDGTYQSIICGILDNYVCESKGLTNMDKLNKAIGELKRINL